MRLGIAQINTVPGAFDETVGRMVAQSARAAEQGVELLVFPLAALAGIDVLPIADAVSFMRDMAEAAIALSERLACPALVPMPLDLGEDGPLFDALLIDGGEVRPLFAAPDMGGRDAGRGSSRGNAPAQTEVPTFEFGGLRLAFAASLGDLDALDDYDYDVDVVLYASGYPFALDDPASAMGANLADCRLVEDAQAMGAWLVGAASLGGYGDQVFTGGSFVLAPSGELVASAPSFEEALLVADVGGVGPDHAAGSVAPEIFDLPFHLWEAVALGIRDYVGKLGRTDVALCVDGTLSSQVLLALASDALGPLHVHALIGASCGEHAPACRELARRLGVDQADALGQLRGFDPRDMDELQLAELARAHGALVLSSLDKTALALGLEGVRLSAASLCPLGDVYRSDVLDMAHIRNTISPLFRRVRLTERDELTLRLPGGGERRIADERALTEVDEVLLGYVEYDQSLAAVVAGGADAELVDAVLRQERAGEHLRRALPPVLAMSTHTLDDARFPLGHRWHDVHLDEPEELFEGLGSSPAAAVSPRADSAEDESPGEGEHERGPLPRRAPDVEGTLAMLRDLAEQGGFDPAALELLRHVGEAVEQGGSAETGSGEPPWPSLFSEN